MASCAALAAGRTEVAARTAAAVDIAFAQVAARIAGAAVRIVGAAESFAAGSA